MNSRSLLLGFCLLWSTEAVIFECQFVTIHSVEIGNVFGCEANVILSGSDSLENVTTLHGQQWDGIGNNVNYLSIFRQSLESIPLNIDNFFPNLTFVQLVMTNLQSLDSLEQFHNVRYVNLARNNISTLSGKMFMSNVKLEFLNFERNQISYIEPDLVEFLDFLSLLDLSNNPCINLIARNRDDVLELAADLPYLCPEAERPTPAPEQCKCEDEIFELHELNYNLNAKLLDQEREIQQLRQSSDDTRKEFEERFIEIERKLRELSSLPTL